ncbi:hypothetical protein DRN69_02065, partial [Candidatus Pacearchaeota archaeon]
MKRGLAIFLLVLIFMGILSVSAGKMHSWKDVRIKVNNKDKTLQDAVKGNHFKGMDSYADASALNPGHKPSEIWVNVGGKENTLLNALKSGPNGLCPGKSLVSSSSNRPAVYHLASEIDLD